ncbi:MAG: bacteriohemerythrin, partial [Campylobacterales bacterium]|nr:bacteriohemerythrin [Campylobacterales bacterium]
MESIDIFPWDNHFNTGLSLVDEQHYRLVALLNQLARAVTFKSDDFHLNQIFDELLDYTVYHFKTEEAIWGKYFPQDSMLEDHIAVHQEFIDTIVRLKAEQSERSSAEIVEETLAFLARWLASHILESDRFMAYIVLALQEGLDMDTAREHAVKSMSGFTRTLIDLILSIYETLSTNTLQLMYEIRQQKILEIEKSELESKFYIREEYQRTILNNFPFIMWLKDVQGRYLVVNETFVKACGHSCTDSIIGKNDFDIWPLDLAQLYRNDDDSVMQSGISKNVEEFIEVDGKKVWVETYKSPVELNGKILGTVGYAREISERKEMEEALKYERSFLKTLIHTIPDLIFFKDVNGVYLACNRRFEDFFGASETDIVGKTDYDFVDKELADSFRKNDQIAMKKMSASINEEWIPFANDGHREFVEVTKTPLLDSEGCVVGILGISHNITERKEAESKIRLAANVFAYSREGILITSDDGTILDVNNAFTRITGYGIDEVIGQKPSLLKSGRQGEDFYRDLWKSLTKKGHWYGEVWNRRKNGEIYAELLTISTIFQEDGNVKNYVALFSDISTIKEHEKHLEHIAHYDALTGLANRVLLSDRLEQAMIQTSRRGGHLAVAYLDLDGFKEINDRYGHEAGDQLLMAIAVNMKLSLREGDTLARLGGDEFVAVLMDLDDFESSVPTLTRLLHAAAQPVIYGDAVIEVSASVGVTFYPQLDEMQADQLLRQADQAMYQAKQAGKNRFHLFDAQQDFSVRVHHENIEGIRHALNEEQFVLYYQPKVNMHTGEIIGVEALIRWQHPTQGILLPIAFLPVIEDHPLAIDVGEWVISTALKQIDTWQSMGLSIKISVNIGAHQLQESDFLDRLKLILRSYPGVSPSMLELEILETSALEDMSKVSRIISECKKMGINFALDDFGTGYSSLTYLKHLPVSLLKIDQSFIRDMLYDPDDLAILEGILGLGTAFRREVIAEGVETLEHGKMLLQLGCELAQGYAIARPMPGDELPSWALSWKSDPSWLNRKSISRDEVQLLYATVEHSAWVNEVEMFLKDGYTIPPDLHPDECRFGEWLNSKKSQKFSNDP